MKARTGSSMAVHVARPFPFDPPCNKKGKGSATRDYAKRPCVTNTSSTPRRVAKAGSR